MITKNYQITGTKDDIFKAINAAENFAKEKLNDKKQILQIRLLTEELVNMMCTILDFNEAVFSISEENNKYKIGISTKANINHELRDTLVSVSKDGKNASYKGITGRIFQVVDLFLTDNSESNVGYMPYYDHFSGGYMGAEFASSWSLNSYYSLQKDTNKEDWDELEKSILIKLADDVIVNARTRTVEITVLKSF